MHTPWRAQHSVVATGFKCSVDQVPLSLPDNLGGNEPGFKRGCKDLRGFRFAFFAANAKVACQSALMGSTCG